MFWAVDDKYYNADQLLRDAEEHIGTALERDMPDEDMVLLRDAFHHL